MSRRYVLTTDGACWPNDGTGKGGWAYVLRSPDNKLVERSGAIPVSTNNFSELTAILEGLIATPREAQVLVRSDSKYAINACSRWSKKWAANGWITKSGTVVKNLELIRAIIHEMDSRHVEFKWVRGHGDDPDNLRADALATAEVERELGSGIPLVPKARSRFIQSRFNLPDEAKAALNSISK